MENELQKEVSEDLRVSRSGQGSTAEQGVQLSLQIPADQGMRQTTLTKTFDAGTAPSASK